jgi:hypothetical protein
MHWRYMRRHSAGKTKNSEQVISLFADDFDLGGENKIGEYIYLSNTSAFSLNIAWLKHLIKTFLPNHHLVWTLLGSFTVNTLPDMRAYYTDKKNSPYIGKFGCKVIYEEGLPNI